MTTLNNNPLTRSTDSSTHEERHKPEVKPDPEPSSSYSSETSSSGSRTERNDRLGYTHDFKTISKTTAYRNHIKNSELETREVFEQETLSPENIQQTLPTYMMT